MIRRRTLGLAASLLAAGSAARAGWLDLFNGARVGQKVSLDGLRYVIRNPAPDSTVTMLYFWASWCAPCKEAMPALNALFAAKAAKGLSIVAVTNEPEATVARFAAAVPIHLPVGLDESRALFKSLGVRAMPYAVVINRQGEVLWVGERDDLSDAALDRMLASAGGAAR